MTTKPAASVQHICNMSTGQGYDRRRNNGPETSFAPVFHIDEEEIKRRRAAKGKAPARDDGRQSDALRPICELPANYQNLSCLAS